MASSGEDQSSKVVHGTPGELVWVLRRYRAWWPAQILDPDQLPEGSFRKPGLPFKLLGREEDPIVEWYNLEKSKRVKALRCGEFGDCIEKAKASSSLDLSKKPSRYAQKDVAILQALELEKASLGLDQPKISANSGAQDEDHHYVHISSSFHSSEQSEDADEDLNKFEEDSDLAPLLSQSGLSFEEPGHIKEESNHHITAHESSDDGHEAVKRTRGLEDQGMVVAPIMRRKRFPVPHVHEFLKSVPDVHRGSQGMEKSTSEWKLKRKRNCRSKKMGIDGKAETYKAVSSSSQNMDPNRIHGSLITDSDGYLVKSSSIREIQTAEHLGWNWNVHRRESHERGSMVVMAAPKRQLPHRHSRFMLNPKYDSGEFSLSHHVGSSSLYDVTVRVEANYRPQNVPFISLMSKIYSRPVTGHPLTVEVLDDGACDDEIKVSRLYSSSSEMDSMFGGASAAQGGDVVYGRRPRGRPPRNDNWSQRQCSMAKPRKNGHSSKKYRTLSSLIDSYEKDHQEEFKPLVEKIKSPCIPCVPLAVVFSRLNADLNQTKRPLPRRNSAALTSLFK